MRKICLLMTVMTVLLWGCGEAGIQSDVSQSVDIDPINVQLSVPAILIGTTVPDTPEITVMTDAINISVDEFEGFFEDATRYTINSINYSIVNFPSGSSADMNFDMEIVAQGQSAQDLVEVLIEDLQNNVSDVRLYDRDTPGNVNAAGIALLEQSLLQNVPFVIQLNLSGRDVTLQSENVDFQIIFNIDVTARLQLD